MIAGPPSLLEVLIKRLSEPRVAKNAGYRAQAPREGGKLVAQNEPLALVAPSNGGATTALQAPLTKGPAPASDILSLPDRDHLRTVVPDNDHMEFE